MGGDHLRPSELIVRASRFCHSSGNTGKLRSLESGEGVREQNGQETVKGIAFGWDV